MLSDTEDLKNGSVSLLAVQREEIMWKKASKFASGLEQGNFTGHLYFGEVKQSIHRGSQTFQKCTELELTRRGGSCNTQNNDRCFLTPTNCIIMVQCNEKIPIYNMLQADCAAAHI